MPAAPAQALARGTSAAGHPQLPAPGFLYHVQLGDPLALLRLRVACLLHVFNNRLLLRFLPARARARQNARTCARGVQEEEPHARLAERGAAERGGTGRGGAGLGAQRFARPRQALHQVLAHHALEELYLRLHGGSACANRFIYAEARHVLWRAGGEAPRGLSEGDEEEAWA